MSALTAPIGLSAVLVAALGHRPGLTLTVDRRESGLAVVELPGGRTICMPDGLASLGDEGRAWRLTTWGLLPTTPPLPHRSGTRAASLPSRVDLSEPWPPLAALPATGHAPAAAPPGRESVAVTLPPAPTVAHSNR